MVGDTMMDVRASKNAGCYSIAVTYGIGKKEDLEAENPDLIIDDFKQILSLI